MHLAEFMLIL